MPMPPNVAHGHVAQGLSARPDLAEGVEQRAEDARGFHMMLAWHLCRHGRSVMVEFRRVGVMGECVEQMPRLSHGGEEGGLNLPRLTQAVQHRGATVEADERAC